MAESSERLSSTLKLNSKIHSDSGYGSNKSNSQSQRSSGSSKSHQSSMSSGSGSGYPPHPNAPVSNADCQQHGTGSPNASGTSAQATNKRQGKKKMNKQGERKPTAGDKNETRTSQETQGKEVPKNSQLMDQGANNTSSLPSTPQPHGQMSPASKASSTHDSKALQVAALTHVLSCMKKFQDPIQAYYSLLQEESEMNDNGECDDCTRPNKVNWEDFIAENQKEAGNEEGFATVVSLDDGVVVYITPTIANILGFPKDMLLGRSFIDFVHPKDRMAFASHITCGINFPIGDQSQCMQNLQGPSVKTEPFYCRLRQYRGLKTVGFGVTDKTMMYFPFKLTMQLKKVEIPVRPGGSMSKPARKGESDSLKDTTANTSSSDGFNEPASAASVLSTVYLVICATRIKSAYQYPQEVPKNPGKFITRHSASCHFGHMDSDAISYLGHLPQDLIGNSVLDYYHPEDLSLLKDIYGSVMQEQGKPFRSKPYRFRVFNGTFAMLETDWSCFINPWSWKLEFVIGQHRVIEGPMNPNVFMQPKDEDEEPSQIPEQNTMKEMTLQDEIRKTLTETVSRRISDPLRQQSSRRRKDLAALMETLLEKMAKTENSEKSGSQCSGFSVLVSCKERDSVMLGEISPHHDHDHDDRSGSNQSSSTPPSYNQLNYRDNIERFFQSQPKTERSDESADPNNKMDTQNQSSESDSKSSPTIDYSSGSNMRNSSGSNESGNDRAECVSPQNSLTQALLTRCNTAKHNQDMERCMMQKHRESRGKSSTTPGSNRDSRYKHSDNFPSAFRAASSRSMDDSSDFVKNPDQKGHRSKPSHSKVPVQCDPTHGLKRTGNFSWDGDSHAGHAKQPHLDGQSESNSITASNSNNGADPNGGREKSINLWPPFSISVTPGITTPSYRQTGPYPRYASANPSSAGPVAAAGVPTKALPGVCLPGYHYIDPVTGAKQPAMLQVPHPSTPMAAPQSAVSSSVPGGSSGTSPYIFLPGQQQFQQVQLLPAGVVYQPVSHHQMFGQHTPILMPVGTMIHPGQSILMAAHPANQLGHTGAPGGILHGSGFNFISLPTPPVSVADSRTSKSNSASNCSGGIPSLAKSSGGLVLSKSTSLKVTSAVIPPTGTPVSSSGAKLVARTKSKGYCSAGEATSREKGDQRSQGSRDITDSSQSGSDDSMNASSKDSSQKNMEEDQSSQSCWDDGDNEEREESEKLQRSLRNKEPPWMQNVVMSDALKFTYQMPQGNEEDILRKDMKALKIFGQQSSAVNDQLAMLYREMDMDGCFDTGLHLEEGISSSSGDEHATSAIPEPKREVKKHKKKMCHHRFDKMSLAFDEAAPFPPEHVGGSWPQCKNPKSSKGQAKPSSSNVSSKKSEGDRGKLQSLHLPPPPPPTGKKSKKLIRSATVTEAAA